MTTYFRLLENFGEEGGEPGVLAAELELSGSLSNSGGKDSNRVFFNLSIDMNTYYTT